MSITVDEDFRAPPPSVVEAERKLDRLVKEDFLSLDGRRWLEMATDPFHDTRLNPTGYPDINTTGSVIQTVSQTFTVSNAGGITGNCDAHIVLWPLPLQRPTITYVDPISEQPNSFPFIQPFESSNTNDVGGCTSQVVPTGAATLVGSVDGQSSNGVQLTDFADGQYRVVGMGFEVHDTTADLYKQGAVTVYRVPNPSTVNSSQTSQYIAGGSISTPGTVVATIPLKMLGTMPTVVSEAKLIPDSRQWEARKGCYCVSTLSTIDNPPVRLKSESIGWVNADGTQYKGSQIFSTTKNSNTYYLSTTNNLLPYNTTGAYFTGLHPQFSLQVNVVWFVERFPGPEDNQLLVLARPSPAFDSMALDMYSLAMSKMPVGVPVSMNPLGEWFEDVVNDVAGFAAPALAAAGIAFPEFAPILEPLSVGVGALKKGVLEPRAQARRAKKKSKKQKLAAKAAMKG